ncbi:MAG: hypothetical protein KF682_04775 [Nitrospira sp.]|nr:hypothetical protein [Nitrospira sp.]
MRSGVQINRGGCDLALCLILAATLGGCAQLKSAHTLSTPTQATPEQAAERERESQLPKAVQARSAESSHQSCRVTFDDEAALGQIYGQARSTLALKTSRGSNGQLQICHSTKHTNCWTYRQHCSRSDINLDTIGSAHYHLSMETGIECYTLPDPGDGLGRGFGRLVEWKCTDVDWVRTPRVLTSHDQSQWVKIWLSTTDTRAPMYFDLESIQVLPDTSIQLWFRKRDGTWWFWPELQANTTWTLHDHVRDVSEVRIRGAKAGRTSSYVIGSVTVRD